MSCASRYDSNQDWLTASEAKKVTGCGGHPSLLRLVVLDRIRVRNDPGVSPRYHRGDCERVAQARTQAQAVGA